MMIEISFEPQSSESSPTTQTAVVSEAATTMPANDESRDMASIETNEMVQAVVFDTAGAKLLEEMMAKIPDQMAFKIGDVADLADVKPYVLRYWEQEFDILRPKKAVNNQRIYSRRDVETVLMIKKFLHIDKFSIPGAKRALKLARKKMLQPMESIESHKPLLTEQQLKDIDVRMEMLLSRIRSTKGKLVHKFFQLGL